MHIIVTKKKLLILAIFTVSLSYIFLNYDIANIIKLVMKNSIAEEISYDFYVSPQGNDSSQGSFQQPFKTIQKAVNLAQPGQTIYLLPGQYFQDIVSARNGSLQSPISILGRQDAIIKGAGASRVIEINHDNIIISGFTLDGLYGDASKASGYRDMLNYAVGKESKNGVTGLKITDMNIKNSGGECIRLKYFAQNNEIANNVIQNCGIYDFKFSAGGKNGEGIYIGTAPEQLSKNPTLDIDKSNNNYIHNNSIQTNGNEGVDIKEGSTGNIVEYNIIRGQKDSESGGLDSRGDSNIFRYNDVAESLGAGIRFGGDNYKGVQYGKNNIAYGNKITNNKFGAFKIQATPQGNICGNILSGNGSATGDYGSKINFTIACDASILKYDANLVGPKQIVDTTQPVVVDPIDTTTTTTVSTGQGTIDGKTEYYSSNPDVSYLVCSEKNIEVVPKLSINSVQASSFDANEGCVPQNALDDNLDTRWSASGLGEWIEFKLAEVKNIAFLKIAFYKGDLRQQKFYVEVSSNRTDWTKAYIGESRGDTTGFQKFDFTDTLAKYVRIKGDGNTTNPWNSITEVQIFGFN